MATAIGRRRRIRKGPPPASATDVPVWLATNYGVALLNGEPDIVGLASATARANSILRDQRLLWREKIETLRTAAREARTAAKRDTLLLEAARAEVSMRGGRRYPRADVVALNEFLFSLVVHLEEGRLPFTAVCFLAWWAGFLPRKPDDADAEVVRELRRLRSGGEPARIAQLLLPRTIRRGGQ
jgi:hypothetical protein